jgi:hypothetical protein
MHLRRTWSSYYDHDVDTVYLKTSDGYAKCLMHDKNYVPIEVSEWQPNAQSVPTHLDLYANVSDSPLSPFIPPPSRPRTGEPDLYTLYGSIPPLRPTPVIVHPITFDEYIPTLPVWEQTLFVSLEYLIPPYELASLLFQADLAPDGPSLSIQFVSDGSQIDDTTSVGWCLSLSDGTRLARCSGPGHGPGTSHRAEGYGVLSAVCFVSRLQKFTTRSEPWPILFSTDNKGLLIRIAQRQAYIANYANATLAPDWDLIEEIVVQLRALTILPTFKHVKGRQDDHVAYHDLPLDAQLNVDADALAGSYISAYPAANPRVPMTPTTGAQLILQDQTITGHYASRIRAAAATPDLVAYLRKRNTWSRREWLTINLEVYSSIIRRNSHRHINVVKYIHDKLPTATIRQYTDSHITKRCLLFHDEMENFSHVLRCAHPSRHAWRHDLLQIIRDYYEGSHTCLALLQIAVEGLRSWFRSIPLSSDTFPSEFHPLIREQNNIGWFGFLRGFTSRL